MKIFRYILVLCLILPSLISNGQEQKKKIRPKRTDDFITMKGIRIGLDLSRPFQSYWNKGDRRGEEAFADVEIKPNIFTVAEAGWEKLKIDQEFTKYHSAGSYLKIGLNYNLLQAQDKQDKDILYVGCRYAFCVAQQQYDSYTITNYWGSQTGSYPEQSFQAHWAELLFGMQAEVLKNFFLGWAVRVKIGISHKDFDLPSVYFIPGYGTATASSNLDFSYTIAYQFPFHIRKQK